MSLASPNAVATASMESEYHGAIPTGAPHVNSAARLRAELTASFDRILAQHEQLSVLQSYQSTAVAEHQSAAQSASAALEDVLSWVNQSLPVRRSDIVRYRNSLQATIHTAAGVQSTSEAVAFHQDTMRDHAESLCARFP
ncbi:unnamed protein product [Penicillium bialowiezense]